MIWTLPACPLAKRGFVELLRGFRTALKHPWALAIGTAFLTLMLFINPNLGDEEPRRGLVATKSTLDFGTIPQGAQPDLEFFIENMGTATVTITRVRTDCSCTRPELSRERLEPGQRATLRTRFDSRSLVGFQDKVVTLETSDPVQPRLELHIVGRIVLPPRPRLNIEPSALRLGRIPPGAASAVAFLLQNVGEHRLEMQVDRCPPELRLQEIGPWSLPSGASLILRGTVRFPEDAVGELSGHLTLASNDPERPLQLLSFEGSRPAPPGPTLITTASRWSFGLIADATGLAPWTMAIAALGSHTLILGDPAPTHSSLLAALSSQRLAPGARSTLTLRLEKLPKGPFNAEVLLATNDPRRPLLRIPVQGYVGAPILTPLPTLSTAALNTNWDIGARAAGTPLEVHLTLEDPRGGIAWPLRPPVTGGFLARRLGPEQVPPGAAVIYELRGFVPPRPGLFDTLLELRAAGRLAAVRLSGFSLAPLEPRLHISPERLDFGDIAATARRSATLTIYNEGGAPLELRELTAYRLGDDHGLRLETPLPQGTLAPGATRTLTLSFIGRERLGALNASLFLATNDPERPRLPVPINAWVTAPQGSRALRLLYSSDEAGEIEPCGCGGKEQLGGLPRLASAAAAARREQPLCLHLSAGDIKGGAGALYARRGRAAFQSFARIGLDAFCPGELDLAGGTEALRTEAAAAGLALITTNIRGARDGAPYGQDSALRELPSAAGPIRVAILGVLSPELGGAQAERSGLLITDPAATLRAAIPPLRARGCIIVVLAHTGLRAARELAEQVPGIAVMIVGHGVELMSTPSLINGTLIISNPMAGQRLGVLDLALYPTTAAVAAHDGFDRPLDAQLPEDGPVLTILNDYRRALRELPPEPAPTTSKDPRYLGGKNACSDCHEEEQRSWEETLHAKAMSSLRIKGNEFDPQCTRCHTVGQGQPYGFQRLDLSPRLAEVRCESCHGPASAHAARPRTATDPGGIALAPAGGEASCIRCHNGAHSPLFRYPDYWRRIAHGPKPLLALWDHNRDGVLDATEHAAAQAYESKMAAEVEARLRLRPK